MDPVLNNEQLGPAELAWADSVAAGWGRIPQMPMPWRKMGLQKDKLAAWLEENRAFLAFKKSEQKRLDRLWRKREDARQLYRVWHQDNPYVFVLEMLIMDFAAREHRNYYARVRSVRVSEEGDYDYRDILELLRKQKNRCRYCKVDFSDDIPYTIDHRIAVTRGGDNDRRNIQLVCKPCNSQKSSLTHAEFVRRRKAKEKITARTVVFIRGDTERCR